MGKVEALVGLSIMLGILYATGYVAYHIGHYLGTEIEMDSIFRDGFNQGAAAGEDFERNQKDLPCFQRKDTSV